MTQNTCPACGSVMVAGLCPETESCPIGRRQGEGPDR